MKQPREGMQSKMQLLLIYSSALQRCLITSVHRCDYIDTIVPTPVCSQRVVTLPSHLSD